MTRPVLRIAVRRFGPFESAIEKQFADFLCTTGLEADLEAVPMDLNPLHDTLIGNKGLAGGDWDIAFLNTDWLAEAQGADLLEDLTPHMNRAPIADFPHGWSPSLTGLQAFNDGFWGVPYHDGPECLICRRDLLEAAGIAAPETWVHHTSIDVQGFRTKSESPPNEGLTDNPSTNLCETWKVNKFNDIFDIVAATY